MKPQHLVGVWNPSYASNAMEAHLAVLLRWVGRYDEEQCEEDDIYVWWGKVRSSNRQRPLPTVEAISALGDELDRDPDREVHLYLTDYRSLYVGHVGEITGDEVRARDGEHAPDYYERNRLTCDFWFKLLDIRRLVADDTLGVIAELGELRDVRYNDRPVSLYGGMVDLPLLVTRPDGRRFFDPEVRDPLTDGKLWVEFDAECGGVGAMERELRENLFGDEAWNALDPAARSFIATAEKIYRDHRADAAFDFGPVLANFSKALEVLCNAALRRGLAGAKSDARLANVNGRTVDLLDTRHVTLGQLALAIRGEQAVNQALRDRLDNGIWFAGTLPAILDDFTKTRNPGVHAERVDREVATRWRNRLVGVGCQGILTELARVQPRRGVTPSR